MIENQEVISWILNNDVEKIKTHIHEINFRADLNIAQFITHPLIGSCYYGKHKIFKLFVEHGADLNYEVAGYNLLQAAILSKKPSSNIIKYLCQHTDSVNQIIEKRQAYPIHVAIEQENNTVSRQILNYTKDINYLDKKGNTPIMLAFMKNNFTLAFDIIKKKPNLDIINEKGDTAFQLLVMSSSLNLETFKLFLPFFNQEQIHYYDKTITHASNALDCAYYFACKSDICLELIHLGLMPKYVTIDADKHPNLILALENLQLKLKLEDDIFAPNSTQKKIKI